MNTSCLLVDLLGFTGSRGGTETYIRELTQRLPDHLPNTRLIALTNRPSKKLVQQFFPGKVVASKLIGRNLVSWALGELFLIQRVAKNMEADLIWSPANFGPVRGTIPSLLTIHDTIYHALNRGGLIFELKRVIAAKLCESSARQAYKIITATQSAAMDIETNLHIQAEHLSVIAHGTNPPSPIANPSLSLSKLNIDLSRPIVLSTGNRIPHKNFDGLLRALATIPKEARPLTIITGSQGRDPLQPLVYNLGLEDDVLLLGWVATETLEALYYVSSLYACPSKLEGFGLPVIDAMARGCIVLANDIPVLREVGGDAALYADAEEPLSFGSAIQSALTNRNLKQRVIDGKDRASTFTWDQAAHKTATVIKVVLNKSAVESSP